MDIKRMNAVIDGHAKDAQARDPWHLFRSGGLYPRVKEGYRQADLPEGLRVRVYKNLHNGMWSIMAMEGPHKCRVLAYAHSLILTDTKTVIRESGRQRVIQEKKKNVHAFIEGRLVKSLETKMELHKRTINRQAISYNPYRMANFYLKECGSPIGLTPDMKYPVVFEDEGKLSVLTGYYNDLV